MLALTTAPTSFDDDEGDDDEDEDVCSLAGGGCDCALIVECVAVAVIVECVAVAVAVAAIGAVDGEVVAGCCLPPKMAVTKLVVTVVCGCFSGGFGLAPVPVLPDPGLPPERKGWVAREGRCDRNPCVGTAVEITEIRMCTLNVNELRLL